MNDTGDDGRRADGSAHDSDGSSGSRAEAALSNDAVLLADRALIAANLQAIDGRVTDACERSGRSRADVRVLLATKTVPVERIRIAIEAGWPLIGENRVQEVTSKADGLADLPHETHFIGHLQRNKINQVLPHVDLIQSIDRLDLAEAVSKRLAADLDVFIQVNTSAEESKYGTTLDNAVDLAHQVDTLANLNVRGFMTIGLFSDDEIAVRHCYESLRSIRDRAVDSGLTDSVELSMGMSGDFEWAIAEGASMVRIGSAIFGERPTSDSFYWPT